MPYRLSMIEPRILFLAFLVSTISSSARGVSTPVAIVSDFDDTIKITNAADSTEAVVNGLLNTITFSGITELYRGLRGSEPPHSPLIVLSSSPIWILSRIQLFLDFNSIPPTQVILRNWIHQRDPYEYKQEELKKLGQKISENFLLFGDDVEQCPELYTEFAEANPGRVEKIYIHTVNGRAIPAGVDSYYTVFDVALSEWEAERLSLDDALRVGQAILKDETLEYTFPHFVVCPKETWLPDRPNLPQELRDLQTKIQEKVIPYCHNRPPHDDEALRKKWVDLLQNLAHDLF